MPEGFSYTVSPNNIHLESSFLVPKRAFARSLAAIHLEHPDSEVWTHRSLKSLVREWAAHNALHALGIFLPHRFELAAGLDLPHRIWNWRGAGVAVHQIVTFF